LNQRAVHKKYQLECQLESAAPGMPEAAGDGAEDRDFRANSAILKAERLEPESPAPEYQPLGMSNSISKSSVHFVECAPSIFTVLIVLPRRDSLFFSCTS
jgi:hypothetical protein